MEESKTRGREGGRIQFRGDVETADGVPKEGGYPLQRWATHDTIRSISTTRSRERVMGAQVAVEYRALYVPPGFLES